VNINVELDISGGYNGDLYAYLVGPAGGFAVLLNRVGRTSAGDISTYSDAGFDVTLSDSAANGDIHLYQNVFNPEGGVLTGTWEPDARNVDPTIVTDQSPRTADLSSFEDLDPNGTWSITLYDLVQSGNPSTLVSWGLDVTSIPEPTTVSLGMLGVVVAVFGRRVCARARR
jgi:subtilisin-like proprotein convertase family protein